MSSEAILHEILTRWHEPNSSDLPVWCIGDVHGCNEQYEKLLSEITSVHPDAIIYQLGDLIDRGPSVYEVFKLSYDYGVRLLIGNHELNFIQEYFGYKKCRSLARRETHTRFSKLSQDQQSLVIDMILSMQNYATVERSCELWTLSHAPIIKETSVLFDCGAGNVYSMGTTPYTNSSKYKNCVHGHMHWNYRDIYEQLTDKEQEWYNLDSGCVYNEKLTAMELGTKQIIQVDGLNYAT